MRLRIQRVMLCCLSSTSFSASYPIMSKIAAPTPSISTEILPLPPKNSFTFPASMISPNSSQVSLSSRRFTQENSSFIGLLALLINPNNFSLSSFFKLSKFTVIFMIRFPFFLPLPFSYLPILFSTFRRLFGKISKRLCCVLIFLFL